MYIPHYVLKTKSKNNQHNCSKCNRLVYICRYVVGTITFTEQAEILDSYRCKNKLTIISVQMAYVVQFKLSIGRYYTSVSNFFTPLVESLTCIGITQFPPICMTTMATVADKD